MAMTHEFCVTTLDKSKYSFKETCKNILLEIYLNSQDNIKILCNNDQIKSETPNQLLWLAGGGVYIINKEWIPLVRRSYDSPTNPGKITTSTGRSDSIRELFSPFLVIRELFEEIIIFTKDKKLLIPEFSELNNISTTYHPKKIKELIGMILGEIGFEYSAEIMVPAKIEESLLKDLIFVYKEKKSVSQSKALIHLSKNLRDINLLYAIHLDTQHQIEELQFLDTEYIFANGKVKPLKRDIFLYSIPRKQCFKYEKNWFVKQIPVFNAFTEHADFLLNSIHKIH